MLGARTGRMVRAVGGGASLAAVVATSDDDVPSAELVIDVRTRTSYVRSKDVLHTYVVRTYYVRTSYVRAVLICLIIASFDNHDDDLFRYEY